MYEDLNHAINIKIIRSKLRKSHDSSLPSCISSILQELVNLDYSFKLNFDWNTLHKYIYIVKKHLHLNFRIFISDTFSKNFSATSIYLMYYRDLMFNIQISKKENIYD